MASIINLKVEPDKLVTTAKQVTDSVSKMRKDFNNLNNAMKDTQRYWKGLAGNASRKLYTDQIQQIQDILLDMEKYPDDILKMAGLYKEQENKNKALAGSLKSNIIHN